MMRHENPVWFGRDYVLLVRENDGSTGWRVTEPYENEFIEIPVL